MKKILFIFYICFIFISSSFSQQGSSVTFSNPYGMNLWVFPQWSTNELKNAGVTCYRVMVSWPANEPSDNSYTWESSLNDALDRARTNDMKLSLCVFLSFNYGGSFWARTNQSKRLSVRPDKYAEFITALLQYCENRSPGVVEAVEIMNEEPTGEWSDSVPITNNTDQRDPSWYYAEILKAGYNAVKAFNSNILVVIDGIWAGAYHHLDELYQLGCKGYFDRINLHHYLMDLGPPDPSDTSTTWHFPTVIRYLKYIADEYEDFSSHLWITEYGWRITQFGWPRDQGEIYKANYTQFLLDTCRKSGFVEKTHMYVGTTGGYPSSHDTIALIYANQDYVSNPSVIVRTTCYYIYDNFAENYPEWDPRQAQTITTLIPANNDIPVTNPGFELGNTNGWNGVTLDNVVRHSGNCSGRTTAPNSVQTNFYTAQSGRAYEVIVWIRIDALNSDACIILPRYKLRMNGTDETTEAPPNYWGVVDTRNYPNRWRKIRYMVLVPQNKNEIAVEFISGGSGTYWVDDLQIKALNMPPPMTPNQRPTEPTNLLCNGEVNPSGITDFTPTLSWQFNDPDVTNYQGSYRVIVSTNPSMVANEVGDIWDTGRIYSSTTSITYIGGSLSYSTTYYWRVATWDNHNSSSPFSDIAYFSMTDETQLNSPPNKPVNLLCNGQVNPSGLVDFTPDLSWTFSDPDSPPDTQLAYRVLVADNISLLNSNVGNKWDTGKVGGSNNTVTYAGSMLVSGGTYYWKVMTWDSFNIAGPYSDPASFNMTTAINHPVKLRLTVYQETLIAKEEFTTCRVEVLDLLNNIVTDYNGIAALEVLCGDLRILNPVPVTVVNGVGFYDFTPQYAGNLKIKVTSQDGLTEDYKYITALINYIQEVHGICDKDSGKTTVMFPPGTFEKNVKFNSDVLQDSDIDIKGTIFIPGSGRVITITDPSNGRELERTNFHNNCELRMSYNDNDNDGIVDGLPREIHEENLKIFVKHRRDWNMAQDQVVDPVNNIISCQVPYFSKFVIATGETFPQNLFQNYPNPFNPDAGQVTTITYDVGVAAQVTLRIYNTSGELVRELVPPTNIIVPDRFTVTWNGKNDAGETVSSGIYICTLVIGENPYYNTQNFVRSIKIVVLRGK